MKHITITVKSELEDIEPYLKDILTTMKDHDEVTSFSIKTSTFTERSETEHSNNKSISNHEAAEILKLMPKQSEAIKKAIEVLERTKWHTEPPTEEGAYLIYTGIGAFDFANYSKDLYKVDKYDFKHRAGWHKYSSEWGFYEVTVIAWTNIPAYERSES